MLRSAVSSTSAAAAEEGAGTWLTLAAAVKSPAMLSLCFSPPAPNPSPSPTYVCGVTPCQPWRAQGGEGGGTWWCLGSSVPVPGGSPLPWDPRGLGHSRGVGFPGERDGGRQAVPRGPRLCRDVSIPRPPRVTARGGEGEGLSAEGAAGALSAAYSTLRLY